MDSSIVHCIGSLYNIFGSGWAGFITHHFEILGEVDMQNCLHGM